MKKNIIIIILIIIVIILSTLLIIKYNKDGESKLGDFNKVIDNTNEQVNENNTDNNKNEDNNNNTTTNNDNNTTTNNDNNTTINNKQNTNNNNNNNTTNDTNKTYTEDDVLEYFNNIENEVESESKVETFKTKFKDYFTNTIDFIFYDKEIKGHKFKDLTTSAKLKVMAAAIKIDAKIDEKVPNYKDKLSSKYKDIKNELVMNYLDLTVSICSNHEQGCDKAKTLFKEVKTKGKIGLNYVKDILSKGKNKLKDYYELYRDS